MHGDASGVCRTAVIPGMRGHRRQRLAAPCKGCCCGAEAVLRGPTHLVHRDDRTGWGDGGAGLVTTTRGQHPCVEATSDLRSTTATPWLGPWDRVADDLEVGAGVSVDAMRAAIS